MSTWADAPAVPATKAAAAAAEEIRPAAHDVARVGAEKARTSEVLGLRVAGARQQGQCRKQQSNSAGHNFFLAKNQIRDQTGHNCRDFASNEPVRAAFSNGAVKKGNTPQAMAAMNS